MNQALMMMTGSQTKRRRRRSSCLSEIEKEQGGVEAIAHRLLDIPNCGTEKHKGLKRVIGPETTRSCGSSLTAVVHAVFVT